MVNKGKRKNNYESAAGNSKKIHLVEDDKKIYGPAGHLPHEILVEVLKFLPISDRCQMARVCKNWLKASYDETLWYHIDLSMCALSSKQLWSLFRHHKFSSIKSIKICEQIRKSVKNKSKISKALMQKLSQTCTEIIKIEIRQANLEQTFDALDLPAGLKKLSLIRCEIPRTWFLSQRFHTLFNSLDSIDLSSSSLVCWKHLTDLLWTCKNSLKELKLKDCYRVDDKAIEVIVNSELMILERLDLQGTVFTQYGLQLLGSKIVLQLVYLNLKDCKNVTENDINMFKATLGPDILNSRMTKTAASGKPPCTLIERKNPQALKPLPTKKLVQTDNGFSVMKPVTSQNRTRSTSLVPSIVRSEVARQPSITRASDRLVAHRLGGSRTNLNVNQAREKFLKNLEQNSNEGDNKY